MQYISEPNHNNNVEFHFDSVSAFGAYIKELDAKPRHYRAATESIAAPKETRWDLDLGYDRARDYAVRGGSWVRGASDLLRAKAPDTPELTTLIDDLKLELVPQGGAVDVGEFLQNSPECFYGIEEQQVEKNITRVVVSTSSAASVDASDMLNRGRAILSLVDALERNNCSVELVALVGYQRDLNGRTGMEGYITVKQAGEPWTATSAAFALAHPAMSRRLGFRLLESCKPAIWLTKKGYGNGGVRQREEGEIYFGRVDNGGCYNTPQKALKTVIKLARAFAAL